MSKNYNSFPKAIISYPITDNNSYATISYYGNTVSTSGNIYSGNLTSGIYITSDLSFNTLYTFTISPFNRQGNSGNKRVFTINTTPIVTGSYATNSTASNTTLQWYGQYSYVKIYRKITSPYTTVYEDVSAVSRLTIPPYYDIDLSGNTTYNYIVTPYDANNIQYPNSNTIIITTNTQAAQDLSAIYYDDSGIIMNFKLPKNSYSSTYYYQLKANYGGNITTSNGSTSPIIVSGLSSNTTYSCYIINYLDGVLSGTSSVLNVKTKKSLPYFSVIPTFDTTTTNNSFISTAMSYTGQYIYVAKTSTTGYKSTDFGNSWTTITFPNITEGICCSWDASMVYACGHNGGGPNGYMFKSSNYGSTFTTMLSSVPSEAGQSQICCSYNGKYVYWGGSGGDNFKYSSNFGVGMTYSTSTNGRQTLCCSYDGKYLITANNANGTNVFYLNNSLYNYSGGNWTSTYSFNSNIGCCAISSGGTYMLTIHNGYWYRSSDNGTSWTALPSPVNGAFATKGCCMSYTGQYMMVGYNGYLYYSKNYGGNWSIITDSSYGGTSVYTTGNINTQCLTMAPSGAYAIVNNGSNTSYYLIQLF